MHRKTNVVWSSKIWSRSNSIFVFLTNCTHHFHSHILQKTPLKLVNWFQRYEQWKNAKNNRKQKTFSALFCSILKSIFPTSDWFSLITSQMCAAAVKHTVLPNPRFRRPIGLLLTFAPRPAKPFSYFWATFYFLAAKCL